MTTRGGLPVKQAAGPQLASGLAAAALGAVALMLSLRYAGNSLLVPLAVALVAGGTAGLLLSVRPAVSLAGQIV